MKNQHSKAKWEKGFVLQAAEMRNGELQKRILVRKPRKWHLKIYQMTMIKRTEMSGPGKCCIVVRLLHPMQRCAEITKAPVEYRLCATKEQWFESLCVKGHRVIVF